MRKILFSLALLCCCQLAFGQKSLLTNFPEGAKPIEVGQLIGYRVIYENYYYWDGKVSYPSVCYMNGVLDFTTAAKDKTLFRLLQNRVDRFLDVDANITARYHHVDANMFGSLPLGFYLVTKDKKYMDLGLPYADTQWQVPNDANQEQKNWADRGYTWQTRLWIDDMYMITIVQAKAYLATKDVKYLDRAADEMVLYLDEIQRPNGLFYHAPDVPFYWSRGNGWMAVGMTELLKVMPKNHKHYARIMEGYHKMMKSLLGYQSESGMWNQLIDKSDIWAETSGTAMFTYAFIMGVKKDWLDANEYAPAARKAWIAMQKYVDVKGAISECCVGTNKKNDEKYYYDRARNVGDQHAQAAYMWCVNALMEK